MREVARYLLGSLLVETTLLTCKLSSVQKW